MWGESGWVLGVRFGVVRVSGGGEWVGIVGGGEGGGGCGLFEGQDQTLKVSNCRYSRGPICVGRKTISLSFCLSSYAVTAEKMTE